MSFATANRTSLYRVKEVTWGLTPANPALIQCRYTGESLDDNIKTETSKEIRSDRQTPDLIPVDDSPGGDFNFEMSYGSFADLMESLMLSAWSAPLTITGAAADISTVLAVSPAANLTSTTGAKFAGIVAGQWIKLAGFANPGNNGLFHVDAVLSGTQLALSPEPAAAETPAGAAVTIKSTGMVRNGVTEQSYTLVKIFADATTPTRHIFTGQRVSAGTFDMKTGALLTGKWSFKGKQANYSTAAFAGETYPAVSTTTIMNCVQNVQNILQNGAAVGSVGAVMSMSLNVDNQHREQKGLGVLGNVGVVAGSLLVKVTAQQYFESSAQATMFKNATAFSLSFQLKDGFGNVLVVTLPFCKYDSFKENSTGLNTDVMAQTSFQALLDPVTGCMIQIDRFDGP
jgi:hypothetical protein